MSFVKNEKGTELFSLNVMLFIGKTQENQLENYLN